MIDIAFIIGGVVLCVLFLIIYHQVHRARHKRIAKALKEITAELEDIKRKYEQLHGKCPHHE